MSHVTMNNGNNNNNSSKDNSSNAKNTCKKKLKDFNELITCFVCKGYIIDATTINSCLHTFCHSCIVKRIKTVDTRNCPQCEKPVFMFNLRPDPIIRSLIYKIVPGLYQSECQRIYKYIHDKNITKDTTFNNLIEFFHQNKEPDTSNDYDINLLDQYFYSQDEPISMSLEYHMESIFGVNIQSQSNIPQIRYLQCPAAVKITHLKRFLFSKYDLNCQKTAMDIDIIYENEILSNDMSLMDIAYCFNWTRMAPMKFYYRIYKSPKIKRHKNKSQVNVKSPASKQEQQHQMKQPIIKISTNVKEALANNGLKRVENKFFLSKNETKSSTATATFSSSPPRSDLKMIITKKQPSQTIIKTDENDGKDTELKFKERTKDKEREREKEREKEKKEKIKASHSIGKDFKRLRSIDVKYSEYSSSSSSSSLDGKTKESTASKKNVTGTVPHDDSKQFNNNSNAKKISNDNVDEYTFDSKKRHEEKEKYLNKTKRENSPAKQQKFMTEEKNGREANNNSKNNNNNNQLNVPKLKIELPSLKTKITVSKQGVDKYTISPQPHSAPVKSPSTNPKRVRFSFSEDYSRASNGRSYDFVESEQDPPRMALHEYITKIGLKPVEKTSEVLLHKKRKKSKHSKDNDGSKKRRLHAEVASASVDESLKLKLKFYKQDKKDSTSPSEEKRALEFKEKEKEKEKRHMETIDLCDNNSDDLKMVTSSNNLKMVISKTDKKEIVLPKKEEIAPTKVQHDILKASMQPMVCIPNLNLKQSQFVKVTPETTAATINKSSSTSTSSTTTSSVSVVSTAPTTTTVTSSMIKPPDPIIRKPNPPKQVTSTGCQTLNSYARTQTAKMGSPSTNRIGTPQRPFITNINPNVRPQSYPPTLGLLPISSLKRSSSLENNNVALNKQPRLDQVEINAQNKFLNKTTTLPTATTTTATSPPSVSAVRQYSNTNKRPESTHKSPPPITSFSNITKANDFYKKYNETTKKPMPTLLAPASISVTKMSDMMPPPISSSDDRPAVEILRIPSSVPVIDRNAPATKPLNLMQAEFQKARQMKTSRPIPPTIPLAKIKKSGMDMEHILKMKEMMFHSTYGEMPKLINYATSTTTANAKPKEAMRKIPEAVPSLELMDRYKMDDVNVRSSPLQDKIPPFITEGSNYSNDFSKPSLPPIESIDQLSSDPDLVKIHQQLSKDIALLNFKLNQDIASSDSDKINSYTSLLTGIQSYSHQLQQASKKNESKVVPPPASATPSPTLHASGIGRQQNLSVRNIPNPSALMFRNQQPQKVTSTNNNSSKSATATASPPQKPPTSENFMTSLKTNPSVTSSVTSPKPATNSENSDFEELLSKTTIISTNSLSAMTSAPKPAAVDQQSLIAKKNMHLEKLAATLLAAATINDKNKNSSNSATKIDETQTTTTTNNNKINAEVETNTESRANKNDLKKGNAENDNNNNEDSSKNNNNSKTVATTNTTNGDINGKKLEIEEISSNDTKKAEFIEKHDDNKKINNNNNNETICIADT